MKGYVNIEKVFYCFYKIILKSTRESKADLHGTTSLHTTSLGPFKRVVGFIYKKQFISHGPVVSLSYAKVVPCKSALKRHKHSY